jgi:uncharacterized membrane protein YhaH (DUF805 family)
MPMSQLLFSFSGRLNRKPWWLVGLTTVVVMIIVIMVVFVAAGGVTETSSLDSFSSLGGGLLILLLLLIPLIWIQLALGAKRLHDRNKSAWWLVVFYLAPGVLDGIGGALGSGGIGILFNIASFAISIWALVELGFLRGTVGPNQYGPDPLEAKL